MTATTINEPKWNNIPVSDFSKRLMKLTPFQIITNTIRHDYAVAVMREICAVFERGTPKDNDRLTLKIVRRGDLDTGVGFTLRGICGTDAVLVDESDRNYTTFIVNLKEAYLQWVKEYDIKLPESESEAEVTVQ